MRKKNYKIRNRINRLRRPHLVNTKNSLMARMIRMISRALALRAVCDRGRVPYLSSKKTKTTQTQKTMKLTTTNPPITLRTTSPNTAQLMANEYYSVTNAT